MKTTPLILALSALLISPQLCYGWATERIGPDKDLPHPTVEQSGWPAGMIDIVRHDSRVYSLWVNGSENFHFHASPDEIGQLIQLYSQTRLRDHVLTIKAGTPQVTTFKKDEIDYNVNFHYLGGISLAMTRRKGEAETFEPTLTIHVDPAAAVNLSKQLVIPNNIVVNSGLAEWEVSGSASIPKRQLWHAQVQFDDGKPAADFENGVSTQVTLWEENEQDGFDLGSVNHTGLFSAAFSEEEIAKLKSGSMWLTLTVGNFLTDSRKQDPRLDVARMSLDSADLKPVEVDRPGYYYGRLLFEDGSPAVFDSPPWPGAEISISFSYAGRITIDKDGYFRVFFTPEQFKNVCEKRVGKNIYIPDFDTRGRSTALHAFPPSKLSLDKDQAGEIRINKPGAIASKD